MEQRKKDHIELAFESQISSMDLDHRFNYEPVMKPHLTGGLEPFEFLGKKIRVPIWVSSMTGGTKMAHKINHNLARACAEFGMGMGLGSCRIILDSDDHLNDFNVRDVIGDDLPFFANLGIAQMEELVAAKALGKVVQLVDKLRADGLIIHVNPMQESLQPEGDIFKVPALDTISYVVEHLDMPVIVKAVGQGIGPESLSRLLKLPLAAVEYGAFGGTNFAKLELMRGDPLKNELFEPLSKIGHDAYQMTKFVNQIVEHGGPVVCRQIIVSGGIKSFLDGYYLINKTNLPAIYGQASAFLKYAREDYESLRTFIKFQIKGLEIATAFLKIK
jgi:isopentenyl-diphosphate delta-isomerase